MDDVAASRSAAVRLVRTAERLKADFALAVEPSGLSTPAARALLLLDEPLPMGTLSGRLACNQSYITRIADELETRGFVRRVPAADRRVQILTLTPSGKRARTSLFTAVTAGDRVQHRLSAAEQEQLDALLRRLLPD